MNPNQIVAFIHPMAAKAKQTFGYKLTNFKINPKPNFTSKLNSLKFNTPLAPGSPSTASRKWWS